MITVPRPQPAEAPSKPDDVFGMPPMSDLGESSLGISPLQPETSLNPLSGEVNWSAAAPTPAGPRGVDYIAPATIPSAGWKFWFFSLTLLPLVFYLMVPDRSREQWQSAFEEASAEEDAAAGEIVEDEPAWTEEQIRDLTEMDPDDLLRLLPDNKLPGAHLSADSWLHWLYALLSGGLFFGLICVLFQQGQATRGHLVGVTLLTATCGVASLIMFQWFAAISSFMRFGGVFGIVSLIVKLIGFSYAAAMDPETGFLLSLVGFTFGVGLCEEFIKALPILARFRNEYAMDWRGACVWGLASGVGFGVAEGIIYSSDYYNGIEGPGIYVVRFVSCVGLHAIWTASVGILLWHHQEAVRGEMQWGDWAMALLKVQGLVMLLHGLYDTLLKREMTFLALVVAIASFAFLGWLVQWALRTDRQPARRVRASPS